MESDKPKKGLNLLKNATKKVIEEIKISKQEQKQPIILKSDPV